MAGFVLAVSNHLITVYLIKYYYNEMLIFGDVDFNCISDDMLLWRLWNFGKN
jgi:hypothetical protein